MKIAVTCENNEVFQHFGHTPEFAVFTVEDGKVKEYQTELTDVVREYIGRRFDVQSTEKTSDETLRELEPILVSNELHHNKKAFP